MKAKQQHSPFLSWVPPMRLFNDLGSWPSEAQERGLLTSQHLINTYLLRRRLNYCCSIAKSCPTLCDPMDCSTPSFPVLHHLPEFAQTQVHQVSDAIQPSHPLSSSSPFAFNISHAAAAAKSLQPCPTLCNPVDGSPQKSFSHV